MSKGDPPYAAFKSECDNLGWTSEQRRLVFKPLVRAVEQRLAPRLNPKPVRQLTWSEGHVKYIKEGSVFIAFSAKGDERDLLADLLAALNAWNPPPSHLFLAKLQAEMDEYGTVAQGAALERPHALASWYRQLLASSNVARQWHIADSVARHSERLMTGLHPRVEEYAKRLIEAEAAAGAPDDVVKNRFHIDLAKREELRRSTREHNALVSTKTPEGWHLTTGHVFEADGAHWVCVSPACDMVPGQISAARTDSFGQRLPFMAVKLHKIKDGKEITDVQTNRYLFLLLDGEVKSFCFNDRTSDTSTPTWHILFAENTGLFEAEFRLTVLVTEQVNGNLVQSAKDARVVAQLRYEYALNLVQKLGTSLTRIGLNFV